MTKILIAVLSHSGLIKNGCAQSLCRASVALTKDGIESKVHISEPHFLELGRNSYASAVLDGDYTHLLFWDDDIVAEPTAIGRLLGTDKPVIGSDYAKKGLGAGSTAGYFTPRKPVENGITEVRHVGMGLCLIQTNLLRKLRDSGNLAQHSDRLATGHHGTLYGFFDRFPDAGEDASFCRRVREMGEPVYALLTEDIGHIGFMTFRAEHAKMKTD